MDRATFEKQKAFAGEKKPSMQRRCVDHDYTARRMYMVTMVTEGRKTLFGRVVGRSEAVEPSAEAPHIELSPLGEAVEQIWLTIGSHHPEVKVVALQMMPDHLHAILFVTEKMEKPLGKVLLGISFSAIGNRFLLERPVKIQVQCSRSISETDLQAKLADCLRAARQGAVLVSPAISQGEKTIMRAAFEEGLPLIYLQENGFADLAKPGGKRMDACARGQLLILAPWEHHNEKIAIKRGQCLQLNEMAKMICEG